MTPQFPLEPITARDLIEGARNLARLSRDEFVGPGGLPGLLDVMRATAPAGMSEQQLQEAARQTIQMRMNLVMDCYLTGAAEALKMIHADKSPEAWTKFDWEARLNILLHVYGLKKP